MTLWFITIPSSRRLESGQGHVISAMLAMAASDNILVLGDLDSSPLSGSFWRSLAGTQRGDIVLRLMGVEQAWEDVAFKLADRSL